jgi:hypothetical protein
MRDRVETATVTSGSNFSIVLHDDAPCAALDTGDGDGANGLCAPASMPFSGSAACFTDLVGGMK